MLHPGQPHPHLGSRWHLFYRSSSEQWPRNQRCHNFRGNSKTCSHQAACPGCPNWLRDRGTRSHSWECWLQHCSIQDPQAASKTSELQVCQGAQPTQNAGVFGALLANGKKHCFCTVTARSQARSPMPEETNHHGL